jgi:hypothetical protein
MNDELKYQWLEWSKKNNIEPRLINFLKDNTKYLTNDISTNIILKTSEFLRTVGSFDNTNCKVLQMILCTQPALREFGKEFATYLEQHPEPIQEESPQIKQETPIEQPKTLNQKLPNRDTYIKKDEVTNMIIGLETCKTGKDFDQWLESM